ncbi:MAG: major capsid protein [Microviridae sp.]|nr:MAG: major capsid protein [Microviridae sp.]
MFIIMSNSIYSKVQLRAPKRSVFDLSYQNAFTAKFGGIYPVWIEDCVPGDKIRYSNASLVRMNPLSAPFMGSVKATVHTFFVPYRILWSEWEEFITGGRLGTSNPSVPYIAVGTGSGASDSNLLDFLSYSNTFYGGDPATRTEITPLIQSVSSSIRSVPNALPFLAYWKIWNDYYRDQNLCPDIYPEALRTGIVNEDGLYLNTGNSVSLGTKFKSNVSIVYPYDVAYRAWRKDLFTSALPFAQRGDSVKIPIAGLVPVLGSGNRGILKGVQYSDNNGTNPTGVDVHMQGGTLLVGSTSAPNLAFNVNWTDKDSPFMVNLGDSSSVSIEDLRSANALQRWLERNAIGGGRYVEQILSHFAERVPDYRLDRPEFIGGNTYNVMSSRIAQTSEDGNTPLGTLGGEGFGSGSMKPATYRCREHGLMISLMSIIPESHYSQGCHRRNLKRNKLDYFFPEFENLGEQSINNSEIFVTGTAFDEKDFGYGPRYYEYKDRTSETHGLFRTSMSYWVPQRIFKSLPGLNNDFVQVNPVKEGSLNNIFAVTEGFAEQMQVLVHNSVRAIRPMSKFSKFNF